jgi:hypothetical protein
LNADQQRQLAAKLTDQLRRAVARRERPVLQSHLSFSGELLELVLSERKTQTRRPLKPAGLSLPEASTFKSPFGDIGDHVGVLERWAYDDSSNVVHAYGSSLKLRWNAGLYMPRSAVRFALKLTGVHPQQLTDISKHDATAEGFDSTSDFLNTWDTFYGHTEFATSNNPLVWVLGFELVKL